MSVGITVLLRWLAILGMLMAVTQSLIHSAHWVLKGHPNPRGQHAWVGKRVKDRVVPPNATGVPSQAGTTVTLLDSTQIAIREELGMWLSYMATPGQWLCLCGILYLFAGHSLESRRQSADGEGAA